MDNIKLYKITLLRASKEVNKIITSWNGTYIPPEELSESSFIGVFITYNSKDTYPVIKLYDNQNASEPYLIDDNYYFVSRTKEAAIEQIDKIIDRKINYYLREIEDLNKIKQYKHIINL